MNHHNLSKRVPFVLAAVSAAVLLAACGGGDPEATASSAGDEVAFAEPSATVDDRRFQLWDDHSASTIQSEQLALDPAGGGSEVRLIVRMNPAAVQGHGRAAAAEASGEDAATAHARALATKVSAVAMAAESVMAQSVRQIAPTATLRQQYSHAVEGFLVTVPWSDAQRVADQLARNPAVDAVEVDRVMNIGQAAPTVRTLDARAWGVDRIDQRARTLDGTFRSTLTGSGVNVYVVDTGISPHQQFGTRLRSGYSAVNDGRGTVDCNAHGTHVAGTAAGATLGVAPGAALIPVRVMDCNGSGSSSQVIAGLDWIAANGAKPGVVNMSLGGSAFSTLDAAAQRLISTGFTVVAAAGNSNVDACTQSPARASGVISVAASDNADAKASFSNWGSCVALWAPGTNIGSAGIASSTAVVSMNGTSMAAPHVAGAAALVLQSQPAATAAQVLQKLQQQATPNLVTGTPGTMTRALLYAGVADGSSTTPTTPPAPPPVAVQAASVTMATQVPAIGAWTASATVRIVNAAGQPVANARVVGRFSTMTAEVNCTTAATGTCTINSDAAPWAAVPSIGFAITGVTGTQMTYSGAGVRTAQIARPAAPVATVAALTGTMLRPSATSPNWTPQFDVTLLDAGRAAVPGAVVSGVLTIHEGARVVGLQTVLCQTATNGRCLLTWTGPTLTARQTGATLQVMSVTRTYLTYQPGAITRAVVGRVQ